MTHFYLVIQTTLVDKQEKTSSIVILHSDLNTHQRYVSKSLKLGIISFSTLLQYALLLKFLYLLGEWGIFFM